MTELVIKKGWSLVGGKLTDQEVRQLRESAERPVDWKRGKTLEQMIAELKAFQRDTASQSEPETESASS